MGAFSLDSFEQGALGGIKFDITDKLEGLNNTFKSGVKAVEGKFGKVEQSVGDTVTKTIGRNEIGNAVKEYFNDGKMVKSIENLGDGMVKSVRYDDNGMAYLHETVDTLRNVSVTELVPNSEIVKGNFTAEIDQFGRAIRNKITNFDLKDVGERNDTELNRLKRDSAYKVGDDKGHLVPDSFGGPATRENVVAQDLHINRSEIKQVENMAREFREAGHKVDYEVKTNYVGSDGRPSSFEPKITVDGVEQELPKELRKIYNKGDANTIDKVLTNVGEKVGLHHEAGIESAKIAAGITCAMSTVDNVSACLSGEITAEDAVVNIAKDTGTAGAIGYGTGFVTSAVARTMASSSHELIQSLGKSSIPAAAVSFGIASYDSVMDFAQGEIGTEELAYDLGENAVGVAGSIGGAALAGAAVGSVVPGAGTVVGAGAGLVGGMVGYAVSSGAYKAAVEAAGDAIEEHAEEIKELGNKAKDIASDTIDKAASISADAVSDVKTAISNFNIKNALPF